MQSTFKERTIHSAVAQLEGLYDRALTWPAQNDTDFIVNYVPLKEDKMLVMSNETCKRWSQALQALVTDPKTKEMFDKNTAWLEDKIFPTLREKAGLPKAEKKEMI